MTVTKDLLPSPRLFNLVNSFSWGVVIFAHSSGELESVCTSSEDDCVHLSLARPSENPPGNLKLAMVGVCMPCKSVLFFFFLRVDF